jgi:flagellar hook-associated protein 1 FlgK
VSDFVSLNRALSGLRAAQTRMNTIGQNISNVDTPGYTRQVVTLNESNPYSSPVGWMGSGVDVASVTRARDGFLDARVRAGSDARSSLQTRADLLQRTESTLGEPDQGLTGPLSAVWSAFENLASSPSDSSARITALSALGSLTTRVQQVATGLTQLGADARQALAAKVADVNSKLQQVADLNKAISASSANGPPNDLLDKRDQLIDQLASEAGATVVQTGDGPARVVIGAISAADGTSATPLTLRSDGTIGVGSSGPAVTVGGEIGGYQSFLSGDLSGVQTRLDSFVKDFASALNAQHAAGYASDGSAGGPLLSYSASAPAATLAVAITDPSMLALSSAAGVPFPTNNGVNAQALADLRTAQAAGGGTGNLGGALQSMATDLGATTASVVSSAQSQQSLLQAVQSARQGSEGVSIDEEMTNMIEAQRAYEAAARVMTTVDSALDVLINRTGMVGR